MTVYFIVYHRGNAAGRYLEWRSAFAVLEALAELGYVATIVREFHG